MPLSNYELRLEQYQGPLDKLLELIEEKKFEITELSLAQVTSDFLKHIEELEKGDHNPGMNILIADFLVTASRLILIKSRILVPSFQISEEEEEDIRDLEARLRIYKKFKDARENIRKEWSDVPRSFAREFLVSLEPIFLPPRDFSVEELSGIAGRICSELEKFYETSLTVRKKIINLKEKIREIISAVGKEPVIFKKLAEGKAKEELVVFFLAVLHLIKDRELSVSQERSFEDIRIARRADKD